MPFCHNCGAQVADDAKFCSKCGVPQPITVRPAPRSAPISSPPQQRESGGGGGGVVLAIVLVLIIIGAFLFFAQPHGSSNSLLQCIPHQETVYVGYVNTLTQQYQFTTSNKITSVSYEHGAVLYTVHLIDDQGNHFDYQYVTAYNFTPTTITTGC